MKKNGVAKTIGGKKLYQERARKAFPILVRQALANKYMSYSALADELGMPNPRNLNYVLGSVGRTLQKLSKEWGEEIPPINCLVLNKATGLPGEGIKSFVTDRKSFAKLPMKQKRVIIDAELHKIYVYPRWLKVLESLELEYSPKRNYSSLLKINRRRGSGESRYHKQFKEFVSQNPQIFNLPKSVGNGNMEQYLPSGDVIDVLFVRDTDWVVAEVKSKISDLADIYRGLYQCVKYQAVIEAFQSEKGIVPNSRVILVLEGIFPKDLIELKNLLGVEVIDQASNKTK
jgi:hypothetical protein